MKNPACLYEVSFFSVLWMVFPESWKRSCPNFNAHDCRASYKHVVQNLFPTASNQSSYQGFEASANALHC